MPAYAKVVHHVPGRVRIKVPSGRNNPRLLNEIKQSLASAPGVGHVEVHPTTGSVIIHYRRHAPPPGGFRNELKDQGHSSGLFDLVPPDVTGAADIEKKVQEEAEFLAAHSELARMVVNATRELNAAIKRATDNNVDLNVLVPGVLAIYSAIYAGAEFSTPLWVTLGIFSFNSFIALHPSLPESKGHQPA
jgi:hypothetical protein